MNMHIEVRNAGEKGRGVFACQQFWEADVIEVCPLIIVSQWERLHETELVDYYFDLGKLGAAIALGYGSLYNYSDTPNAGFMLCDEMKTMTVRASQHISIGDEIFIKYRCGIWFPVK